MMMDEPSWENGNGQADDDPRPAAAVQALRDRGIDQPEVLLQFGTPEQILGCCHRWDRRQGVGPGLLVKWIRNQEFADEPAPTERRPAQLRARFDEYANRFPTGSAAETHADLIARRWPGELDWGPICEGDLIVTSARYPVLEMECSGCGFVTAVGPRHLHVLVGSGW